MSSITDMVMMNSLNDPSRPKWNEDTPVADFLYNYQTWSMTRYWDDPMRVMQLPSSVPKKYHDKIQGLIFDRQKGTFLTWNEARERFTKELAMDGETSKALLSKLEAKYTGAWIRMNETESIRDYELRYTDLVTRINALIKDLNGDEPPHPDKILYDHLQPSQSSGTGAGIARALEFGPETPRKVLESLVHTSANASSSSSVTPSSQGANKMSDILKNFQQKQMIRCRRFKILNSFSPF